MVGTAVEQNTSDRTEPNEDTDRVGFFTRHRYKIGIVSTLLFLSTLPGMLFSAESAANLTGQIIGGLIAAVVMAAILVLVGVYIAAGVKRVTGAAIGVFK